MGRLRMRLLFVTSTRIGDAVLSTGILEHYLQSHPELRATVACGTAPAGLFRNHPRIERVIPMIKQPRAGHWRSLWRATVGTRWDHVIDLRRSPITALVRSRKRLVLPKRPKDMRHKVVQLADLIGKADQPPAPTLWLPPDAASQAYRWFHADGTPNCPSRPLLGLGPAANWFAKSWPWERFAQMTKILLHQNGSLAGGRVVLFGGPDEVEATRSLAAHLADSLGSERVIDLIGKPTLVDVAGCLAELDLFIGNDSGLMHMAAAAGTPTLGLFGPSEDRHYAPWGSNAAAVRTPESFQELLGEDYDWRNPKPMMGTLTVDQVVAAAQDLWSRVAADRDPV